MIDPDYFGVNIRPKQSTSQRLVTKKLLARDQKTSDRSINGHCTENNAEEFLCESINETGVFLNVQL